MKRDYDTEAKDHPDHRYAYAFDYLMHDYMLRRFEHLLLEGAALELGCFHGHFTRLLSARFPLLAVVEASLDCITEAKKVVPTSVSFHHSTFEAFEPDAKYENVFLIHTLEHLDAPVEILSRVREWLAPSGRLFLATPNAMAASRQVAVKMGLMAHCTAVTPAEAAHGHRVTYALDTLEAEVLRAGLTVLDRGGVVFKGLANFQMDAALSAGIITKEYLDGCYELGFLYPELCSSIYLVCSR